MAARRETLACIAQHMGEQAIGLDCYPYIASSTVLSADRARAAARVVVTWSKPHPEHAGRDLADVAAQMGLSQDEAVARLLPAGGIYFSMDEADVQRILAFEPTMIGSDGLPHDAFPHPRLWATFPRVLGHYSRDARPVSARAGGAQDDRAHRADLRPARPRRASHRSVGRHRCVRSADCGRGRDLPAADRAFARHRHRDRQRQQSSGATANRPARARGGCCGGARSGRRDQMTTAKAQRVRKMQRGMRVSLLHLCAFASLRLIVGGRDDLTAAEVEQYREQGYVIPKYRLPDALVQQPPAGVGPAAGDLHRCRAGRHRQPAHAAAHRRAGHEPVHGGGARSPASSTCSSS